MDAAHIAACSFDAWYPRFRNVTFDSAVLPLPPDLTDFLVQDGVFLPSSSAALPRRSKVDEYAVEGVDYTDWSSDEDDDEAALGVEQFQEFLGEVNAAIAQLGGKVLPKLNWSAPKDAAWVSATNTTACTNADEVLLLLQSSDRIAHDICHAFDGCADLLAPPPAVTSPAIPHAATPQQATADAAAQPQDRQQDMAAAAGCDAAAVPATLPSAGMVTGVHRSGQNGAAAPIIRPQHVLVLRAWRDLRPGREFRCFVRGREVVGISQRDMTQRFGFLVAEREELQDALLEFHEDHIMARFPLWDYTYDVYVTPRGTVKLVDFNPVGGTTAPLLFGDWATLGYNFAAVSAPGRQHAPSAAAGTDAAVGPDGSATHSPEAVEPAAHLTAASLHGRSATAGGPSGGGPSPHNGSSQRHSSSTHSGANGSSSNGGPLQLPDVDFRIIDEPIVMRSAAQGYAVPYDFVDSSVTGALADFVAQTRMSGG